MALTKFTRQNRKKQLQPLSQLDFKRACSSVGRPFRETFKHCQKPVPDTAPSLTLFTGCAVETECPGIGVNVVKVLNHLGYRVNCHHELLCCGAPHRLMGDHSEARKMAEKVILAMEETGDEPIITVCPSCVTTLSYDYETIFTGEPEWVNRAKNLSQRVIEFTAFLSILPKAQKANFGKSFWDVFKTGEVETTRVTYHDSCRLKRILGIFKEPRELLKHAPGVEFVEMQYSDCCCGLNGSCSVRFPEFSGPILEKKVSAVRETASDILAVACPGCLIQLNQGLSDKGLNIRVQHIAEVIASSLSTHQGEG